MGAEVLMAGVCVDDLIIIGSSKEEIDLFKQHMMSEFETSELGLLTYYLGIEAKQDNGSITLKQSSYAKKLLQQAGMYDCNPSK